MTTMVIRVTQPIAYQVEVYDEHPARLYEEIRAIFQAADGDGEPRYRVIDREEGDSFAIPDIHGTWISEVGRAEAGVTILVRANDERSAHRRVEKLLAKIPTEA